MTKQTLDVPHWQNFRIVSFVPAATEMVAALGLVDQIVGISDQCDYPPEVRGKPVVLRSLLDIRGKDSAEIDREVSAFETGGTPMYAVDMEALRALKPTHIITQDLNTVRTVEGEDSAAVLEALESTPEVMSLTPRSLTDIAQNMRDIGDMLDRHNEAEAILIEWKARADELQDRVNKRPHVRCVVMEWVDPIYASGHWVAEMVQMAGGLDLLARPGQDAAQVTWEEVMASAPDVLILAPCNYGLDAASDDIERLKLLPGFDELPAVKTKKVYAVNAGAFTTRPGPRIIDGIEMLAYLLHEAP